VGNYSDILFSSYFKINGSIGFIHNTVHSLRRVHSQFKIQSIQYTKSASQEITPSRSIVGISLYVFKLPLRNSRQHFFFNNCNNTSLKAQPGNAIVNCDGSGQLPMPRPTWLPVWLYRTSRLANTRV